MIRYHSPEIKVTLWPDEELHIGGRYCAIIMDYGPSFSGPNIWYNTGIVCRADTPEEAFKQALDRFRNIELEDL